jgi:transposase-like protein
MPNDTPRVKVIAGRERGRRYTAGQKLRLVEETIQPGMTVSAVARRHGVSPSLLFKIRGCAASKRRERCEMAIMSPPIRGGQFSAQF